MRKWVLLELGWKWCSRGGRRSSSSGMDDCASSAVQWPWSSAASSQADAAVTALHNDALAHVKLNRKAPLFSQLFPDAQSVFERRPLEGLLPELRRMETVLTESETPAPLRGAHLHRIRRAITRGEEALREREEALGRETELTHRIINWRDEANAALRDTQEKLAAIAFDRRFGKEWVETYFPNSLFSYGLVS